MAAQIPTPNDTIRVIFAPPLLGRAAARMYRHSFAERIVSLEDYLAWSSKSPTAPFGKKLSPTWDESLPPYVPKYESVEMPTTVYRAGDIPSLLALASPGLAQMCVRSLLKECPNAIVVLSLTDQIPIEYTSSAMARVFVPPDAVSKTIEGGKDIIRRSFSPSEVETSCARYERMFHFYQQQCSFTPPAPATCSPVCNEDEPAWLNELMKSPPTPIEHKMTAPAYRDEPMVFNGPPRGFPDMEASPAASAAVRDVFRRPHFTTPSSKEDIDPTVFLENMATMNGLSLRMKVSGSFPSFVCEGTFSLGSVAMGDDVLRGDHGVLKGYGHGPSKKDAKRNCAIELRRQLVECGYI